MKTIKNELITLEIQNGINDVDQNNFQIIMQAAFNDPEEMIPRTNDLYNFLRSTDKFIAEKHGFFLDQRNKYLHILGLLVFSGTSNSEITMDEDSEVLKVCLINSSKMVINCNNIYKTKKVIIVNLYDNSELYVDCTHDVKVFIQFMSENAKARYCTDDSCTVKVTMIGKKGFLEVTRKDEIK